MGEPVAMNPAVVDETLVVLLAHAKGALPSTPPEGNTPLSAVAFSLLAMLAHLATASKSLRAQVKAHVPELQALGDAAAQAKRDAERVSSEEYEDEEYEEYEEYEEEYDEDEYGEEDAEAAGCREYYRLNRQATQP